MTPVRRTVRKNPYDHLAWAAILADSTRMEVPGMIYNRAYLMPKIEGRRAVMLLREAAGKQGCWIEVDSCGVWACF